MDNNNYEEYKPAKDFDEMIDYLKKDKNVVFKIMDEVKAKQALEEYNYINVITPFKHKFALKKNNEVVKENGKHIYPEPVDFNSYYSEYKNERNSYPTIVSNILEFEAHFKSAIIHAVLVERKEKIESSNDLISFLNNLQTKISLTKYNAKRKSHMINQFRHLMDDVFSYPNVYCYFDRISLGTLLTLYITLDDRLQESIFNRLKKYNMHLGADQIPYFIDKTFALVDIRNCVMHCNSLEVLTRFYNVKDKTLRYGKNKKLYRSLVEMLKIEK